MDKRQYFIEALQANAFIHKSWIITMFSVVRSLDTADATYPYQLINAEQEGDLKVYFRDPNDGSLQTVDGCLRKLPMFRFQEPVKVVPGDLPNIFEEMETTYGNLLFNALTLVYAFGAKVPFVTGVVKINKIEDMIATRLVDDVAEGEKEDPSKLYVHEYLRFANALGAVAGLTQLDVPAASPKSMSVSPEIAKRRDELIIQYKDQLHDAAILAKIEAELVAMDREWFKGDPAEKFFIKGSTFEVQRKRMFSIFGAETGFNDGSEGITPIIPSLQEGWDIKRLPTIAETLRSGSYNRGHQTAMGGEAVKNFYRTFQNTVVVEDDCGSTAGLEWFITAANVTNFAGLYHVLGNGKVEAIPVTKDSHSRDIIGKRLKVRSPMFCKSKAPSFCAKCVGDALAATPTGLHIATSDVGTIFMLSFMKKMHGSALKTAEFDFKQAFN